MSQEFLQIISRPEGKKFKYATGGVDDGKGGLGEMNDMQGV